MYTSSAAQFRTPKTVRLPQFKDACDSSILGTGGSSLVLLSIAVLSKYDACLHVICRGSDGFIVCLLQFKRILTACYHFHVLPSSRDVSGR